MATVSGTGGAPTFGKLLKRYRLAAGLTQEALAERAALSTRAISALERGINRGPRRDTLALLIEALGLDPPERAALAAAARPAAELALPPGAGGAPRLEPALLLVLDRDDDSVRLFYVISCQRPGR